MYRFLALAMAAVPLVLASGTARADDRLIDRPKPKLFATLPDGIILPEGIAANPANGDIYVGTFAPGGTNWLLRYAANGKLLATLEIGAEPLLGLAYEPVTDMLYVATVGAFAGTASRVQRVAADLAPGTVQDVADIPLVGAPPDRIVANPDGSEDVIAFGNNAAVPNSLAFDGFGNLYVSDSFQGAIFLVNDAVGCVDPATCIVDTVIHDGLLATAGHPPFGANGLALDADGSALFIANTGDDRVLRLDLELGMLSVFAESLNGADGIAFDGNGRLWVAANQADRVFALDDAGRPVAELGGFEGIDKDGLPRGLLFPASLAIHGKEMFVTNLAITLTDAVGDEWGGRGLALYSLADSAAGPELGRSRSVRVGASGRSPRPAERP